MREFQRWAIDQLKNAHRRKFSIQVVGNGKKAQDDCNMDVATKSIELNGSLADKQNGDFKHSLKFLKPKTAIVENVYVYDIDIFKQQLNIYPETRVNK